jgi:DNA-binding CsgD family transcriptional regulator
MPTTRVLLVGEDQAIGRWSSRLVAEGAWVARAKDVSSTCSWLKTKPELDACLISGDACSEVDDLLAALRETSLNACLLACQDQMSATCKSCAQQPVVEPDEILLHVRAAGANRPNPNGLPILGLAQALHEIVVGKPRPLSPQSRLVAVMCALGLSSKEISAVLSIEVSTVTNHISTIRDRLGWRSRHDALRHILDCMGFDVKPLLAQWTRDVRVANRILAMLEAPEPPNPSET